MFGLVVKKTSSSSPVGPLTLNSPFKNVFLVGFLVGGKNDYPRMPPPCLQVTLEACSCPAFAAVPGGVQQPQSLALDEVLVAGPRLVSTVDGGCGV